MPTDPEKDKPSPESPIPSGSSTLATLDDQADFPAKPGTDPAAIHTTDYALESRLGPMVSSTGKDGTAEPTMGGHAAAVELERLPSMDEPLTPARTEPPQDDAAQTQPPAGGGDMSKCRRVVIVICALVGFFFSTLDAAVVATSLVTISEDLHDNLVDHAWVVLAYLLTYMGFSVFASQLSDVFGRRDIQLVSWLIFLVFSLACARSSSIMQLIVFRAFQGIGGSGLYCLSQVTISEFGPTHKPALCGSIIGMTLAVALIAGPLLGGVISDKSDWRWIFDINIPFSAVTMTAMTIAWPLRPGEASLMRFSWPALMSVDFLGSFTSLATVTCVVFPIQQAGSKFLPWSDAEVVVPVCIAGVALIAFVAWETILSRGAIPTIIRPAFPLQVLRNRPYTAALLVTLVTGYNYFSLMVTIPERFQIINNQGPLLAGIHLIPMLAVTAFGSMLGGAVQRASNRTPETFLVSAALQLIAMGLMTTFDAAASSTRPQYGFQAIFGLGAGLCFSAGSILTSLQLPPRYLATGHGIISQVRVLGGCIGIAIGTLIFQGARRQVAHDDSDLAEEAYARVFAKNVRVMLWLSTASMVIAALTWQPRSKRPTMASLAAHQINARQGGGVVSTSSAVGGAKVTPRESISSGGTELQDMGSRRPISQEGTV